MICILYLNNASTTRPDEKVIEDFVYCAKNYWHNPSDVSEEGLAAKEIIKIAQKQIADSINAKPGEIYFTSGGSESNNWAIKGAVDNYRFNFIISTEIEHPSVYNTCKAMENCGAETVYVPVDKYGRVILDELKRIIKKQLGFWSFLYTDSDDINFLASIMMANNEIGTVQDIAAISEIVHSYGGSLHVDAVQAYMHMPIDVEAMGIDMMSTSFHKFGGFKNCGFLYVREGIELTPLIHGGHQFDFMRAGTENVPMIYAMGNHVARYKQEDVMEDLFMYLFIKVMDHKGKEYDVSINGSFFHRLYNNLSFTFKGISSDTLIGLLETQGIYVSAGSACCAGEKTPSRVLKTIGLSDEDAFSTIRVSLCSSVTKADIDFFVEKLVECIRSIKMFMQ